MRDTSEGSIASRMLKGVKNSNKNKMIDHVSPVSHGITICTTSSSATEATNQPLVPLVPLAPDLLPRPCALIIAGSISTNDASITGR